MPFPSHSPAEITTPVRGLKIGQGRGLFVLITSIVILLILLVLYIDAKADSPPTTCLGYFAEKRYNIPSDDPAYSPKLDRDGDGLACER